MKKSSPNGREIEIFLVFYGAFVHNSSVKNENAFFNNQKRRTSWA